MKKYAKNLLVSLSIVGLVGSGCSTLGDGKVDLFGSYEDFVARIRTVAKADLINAARIAEADGDKIALTCWAYASQYLEAQQPAASEDDKSVVGLATIIQSVRHAKSKIDSGIPTDLRIACAALYNDVRRDALKIAASAAATGALKRPVMIP